MYREKNNQIDNLQIQYNQIITYKNIQNLFSNVLLMYIVLFHRYDRLGSNLINYIAQIIYAHYHGYYIKFIDNKYNHSKYSDSRYYKILLNYINNVLNINNDTSHCYHLGSDDEIL